MMKNLFFLFLMMISISSLVAQSNPANYAGNGTEANPYQIKTVNDLENMVFYEGPSIAYFKLMNDLDLSGINHTPVGVNSYFYGRFDGNYHVISNLKGKDKSLFGTLASSGRIKNLTIKNADITTDQSTTDMGILVLRNQGTIENCFVQGKLTTGADMSVSGKGGITANNSGVIKNCFVDVQISGRHRIGGIAGINSGGGMVENCYTTGKLLCTDFINGGIVGSNEYIVEKCVNIISPITGNANPSQPSYGTYRIYSYQGRGSNNYSLNTATINGSTVTTGTTSNYNGQNVADDQLKTQSFWQSLGYDFTNIWKMSNPAGPYKGYPIFKWQDDGFTYAIYTVADLIRLSNDVNAGDSKAGCMYILMTDLDLSGINYLPVGTATRGFAGIFDGNGHTISNLAGNDKHLFRRIDPGGIVKNLILKKADITTTQSSVHMAILTIENHGTIENCYAEGKITTAADISASGKGGITGYNTGIIRNCFVDVQISGRQRIGGIAGINTGGGIVENCYTTGKLVCTDLINGGVVGSNDDVVKNCVNIISVITGKPNPSQTSYGTYRIYSYQGRGSNNYSLNTATINGSTVTTGTTSNYNGQNATNTQLKSQSFWQSLGYDFTNIWKMSSAAGPYKGYPIFKWQDDKEFKIYTVADLLSLSNDVNAGDSKAGCMYILMTDLDLSGVNYLPVGTATRGFAGIFDGNGHTISNLAGNDKHLFRRIDPGGIVKNLILKNADITTTQSSVHMAILTIENHGTIENCYAEGKITTAADISASGKGGITGYNTGIIRNCFVDVQISGRQRIGAIAGINTGGGIVENCYTTGKLVCTDLINGGVVGSNDDVVKNCVNIISVITGKPNPSQPSYGTYRIYSYQGRGSNNYSLNTATINGSTVSTGTTSNYNGQNATNTQLKSQSFWQSLGYDFTNIWKMSSAAGPYKGYPIFKWQDDNDYMVQRNSESVHEKAGMEINIYPNPTNGVLNIESDHEVLDIKVYNLSGQLLFRTNEKKVDLRSFSDGIYIIDSNGKTYKVVKQ